VPFAEERRLPDDIVETPKGQPKLAGVVTHKPLLILSLARNDFHQTEQGDEPEYSQENFV